MLTQDDRESMRQRAAEADTLAFALGRAHCGHVAGVLSAVAADLRVALSHLVDRDRRCACGASLADSHDYRCHACARRALFDTVPPAPPPGFNDSEGDEG